jgi:predicted dehydrogenase
VPFAKDLASALRQVDAVIISSPTNTHESYFLQAAEIVPNIFVEKPLTDGLESTHEIAQKVEQRCINLQVGFIERFNPAVAELRKLLERSEKVVSVDFTRTNKLSARITDVDVVLDLMIHDIDLALYINGPVKSVDAHGVVSSGMIEFASSLLSHENGRFSRIQASRITDKKMRSIQATCTDMFVDCELVASRQSQERQVTGEPYVITAVEETIEVRPQEALLLELQAFVRSCRGGARNELPSASAAVAAMEVAHLVRAAILD